MKKKRKSWRNVVNVYKMSELWWFHCKCEGIFSVLRNYNALTQDIDYFYCEMCDKSVDRLFKTVIGPISAKEARLSKV